MIQDNTQYELVVVMRVDDLEGLPILLSELRKTVKKITSEKLDTSGGEESGYNGSCSGWYDWSLRDREKSADSEAPTEFPIRVNSQHLFNPEAKAVGKA